MANELVITLLKPCYLSTHTDSLSSYNLPTHDYQCSPKLQEDTVHSPLHSLIVSSNFTQFY